MEHSFAAKLMRVSVAKIDPTARDAGESGASSSVVVPLAGSISNDSGNVISVTADTAPVTGTAPAGAGASVTTRISTSTTPVALTSPLNASTPTASVAVGRTPP